MRRRLSFVAVAIFTLLVSSLPAQAAPALKLPGLPPEVAFGAPPSAPSTGEQPDLRTRMSKTVRQANGKFVTTIYSVPIHYRDAHGKWQPIDSTLVSTGGGQYAWRNRANGFSQLFKNNLGQNFLRVDVNGKSFLLSAVGASNVKGSISGAQVTYSNAFRDATLRYSLSSLGAEETMILGSPSAATTYRFILTPPAKTPVDVRPLRNGAFAVMMAPAHQPVFILAAPTVQDSPSSPKAIPAPQHNHASLAVSRNGNDFVIDLSIDSQWLHAGSRHFPVFVDPTLTIQPDTQDADFSWNYPTYSPWLGDSIPAGTDDTYVWRPGIQFDLSSIPAGVSISSANLGLYYNGYCLATANPGCPNVSHTVDLHRMTSPWTTSSTTQQVTYDATTLSSFTLAAGAPDEWMNWDATVAVQNWLAGTWPNDGLILMRNPDNTLNLSGPYPPGMRFTADTTILPELNVTYLSDAVTLNQPTTLHANGADLSWSRYTGAATGAPFQKYEVHRSQTKNFSPSSSTLLTTINDISVTSYRDTTAAPNTTFYYAVVANTSASNQVSVTLPADGLATKTLQPAPGQSQDTYITQWQGMQACNNFGANDDLSVGTDSYGTNQTTSRGLLSYNLNDVPTGSTITNATLSLYRYNDVTIATTVHANRVTHAWGEGTGVSNPASCTGDGATWYEANGGVNWTTQGGDFATGSNDISSAVILAANQAAGWDGYDITNIAKQWVTGGAANLGVLLKYDTETIQAGNEVSYWSNDYTGAPTLRPKLTITYQDGSHAVAPTVNVSAPAPNATVMGTSVNLTATATDDGYVAKVEFYIDGTLVGSTTGGSPFGITWNSTTVANGSHTLTAKAYDNAGNTTTSAGAGFSVENLAAPTSSVISPTGGTLSGTATVTGSASAAGGLTQVEFYFDNTRFATDTAVAGQTSYSASWNTLDPNVPAYDGTHTLTIKAYDQYGQTTTSAGVTVTVANTSGSQYVAGFTTSTGLPPTAVYDPSAGTQATYNVAVTVSNKSNSSWSSTYLYYRWFTDSSASTDVGNGGMIAMNLKKGTSSASTNVSVPPPTLPDGVNQAQYQLRFDLYNSSTATWFASKGNQPLQNPVIVNKKLKVALGLEKYYQYVGNQVGGNMQHLVNVANGNSILRWTPFNSPGRGLATVVDFTYNSLEEHSDSPAGNNFSLAISGLTRFGNPLDIHPNNNDTNTSNRWISFVDGDGTYHKFQGNLDSNGLAYYVEPPGVHLYLRQYSTTDTTRWWAFTRPDRVTYFFNQQGYPTYVTDKNGNSLTFTLYQPPSYDAPGGPTFQITKVTDAGGRSYTINYYTKATAKKPQVRGKISSILDHSGHELDFSYYEDGNLLSITQKGGTNVDGSVLPARSWIFTYTTSDGSGPAISSATARANPDPKTSNESTKLYSVRDPNGNETTFAYITSGIDKWKLSSFTTRDGQLTSLSYDDTNLATTLTAPLSRTTKYTYDSDGKVTSIVNPLNQVTTMTWTGDFAVSKVTEPSTNSTQYSDDNNGYLTDKYDQLSNHSELRYQYVGVDANDIAAHWCPSTGSVNGTVCAPRTQAHISQLSTKQDPAGVAAGGYQWSFSYDGNGNMTQVTDPYSNLSKNGFNTDGTLASSIDANGHTTQYTAYDANGLPTTVVDANGHTATFAYDADGLMQWQQDAAHSGNSGGDPHTYRTYFYYDSFHRLGGQSSPKSTSLALGTLLFSDTYYDANDNVVKQIAAHYGAQDTYTGPTTTISYDHMDRKTQVTNPDTSADPAGERTQYTYDAAGRMASTTQPNGVLTTNTTNDFATFYSYDALDRVVSQTEYTVDGSGNITQTFTTVACYNAADDMTSITAPKAQLTASTINCASSALPYTTYYTYDKDHRALTTTDPDGHQQAVTYDANGNIRTQTDADGNTTTTTYDQMNRVMRVDQPFVSGSSPRNVTTIMKYDAAGNRVQQISPRAYDASTDKTTFNNYVTKYSYDPMNQLIRTDLPVDGTYATQYYVHQQYDPNGRVVMTSLPDTNSDPNLVPANKKTNIQYFDTGWIYTSQDPGMPRFHFDYTADGKQSFRAPEDSNGNVDLTHQMTWAYFPDGDLQTRSDTQGQSTTYTYDANNNMTSAHQSSGITTGDQVPVDVKMTYDGLNRMSKVDQKKTSDANYTFTTMAYDLNSNVTDRFESGTETSAGVQVTPGKQKHYDYDPANWLQDSIDYSTNPTEQITEAYFANGLEKQRVIAASNGSGGWNTKQTTNWDYFANDKLDHMSTLNGAGTTLESHTVSYVDSNNIYVDGNRTQDTFTLKGPSSTAPCYSSSCTATYQYDPRDRLVSENDGNGNSSTYTLDGAGNITQKTVNGTTTTNTYNGNQIQTSVTSGVTTYYNYDADGNLSCTGTTTGLNCNVAQGGTVPSTMTSVYTYDYLDRLASFRAYSSGTQTDSANYIYDPLDRVVQEVETHPSQSAKTTTFTYQGIGNQLTEEKQSNSSGPITTKDYTYDAQGHRLTMTDTPNGGASTTYTYGYDVHDSVSLLIDPNGNAKSSYGYTAYGDSDTKLSQGDTDKNNPFNSFRYMGKRYDSGSGSMNMGARSFNSGSDSFLQPDIYHGALANLGLSSDPLSQNRYSLAGGNPLSFIESDGHVVVADGGGGGGAATVNYANQSSTSNSSSGGGGGGHKDCGFLGLGCTWVGQQASQFVQGVGDGLGDLWSGAKAIGSLAQDCVSGGAQECGSRLEKMGSYIVNHPGDFFGSMIDYKDLSQGNYAKWAGHLAPSILLTVATAGGAGAVAKGAEAIGLAAEGAEAAGEAGVAAAEGAGEAGVAASEAGAAKAAEGAGEAAGDAAAGTEKAASEAGSGTAEASAGETGAEGSAGGGGPSLRIYAAEGRAAASEESGVLSPGASGKLFATDAKYEYGNIAQSNLAINARGEDVAGYWEVPPQYASKFSYVGRVQPTPLWEGGGREFTMPGSIPYDQLGPFRRILWSAYGQ